MPGTTVFIDGRFVEASDDPILAGVQVSGFDSGLQHAVGLFETMTGGVNGAGEPWVLGLDDHIRRLAVSAAALGLSDDLRESALAQGVIATVRRAGLARSRVRLTLTGGPMNLLTGARPPGPGQPPGGHNPTVLILAQPATDYPAAMFERGVSVTIADARANPFNPHEGHKTLNYWWRLSELRAAAAKGAAEAVVLSVTNHLCGGCVSNLFLVNGRHVLTPIARGEERGEHTGDAQADDPASPAIAPAPKRGTYLPSPVLPGITRGWVIEQCERWGLEVERRMLSVSDLLDAGEVLLTNSSWGVLPVVKVEAAAVADGVPGPMAARLRTARLARMD